MKKPSPLHALVFDGTSYYVVSLDEAIAMQKKDKHITIERTGNDLDFLSSVADKLNEEL